MACGPGTLRFSFDLTNPEALRWARTRSAQLVTDVTQEAKIAIRRIIERSFAEGIPPRETAKLLRAVVGLTERDALAVMRRQVKLMAGGVPPARAQAMAEAYAGTLHRARALTIARTETMAASNAGQQQLWNQAVRAGHLDASMNKTWVVTDDELLCEVCAPMAQEQVAVQEEFSIGNPPGHPRCRCTIGLVEKKRRRA